MGAELGRRVQPPMLANQQLVTAMEHPIRAHAVTVLNERVACASELGEELGLPPRRVSWHLHKLEKLGVIELVRVDKTPGGRVKGKFYRALARSWFDPESWKQVNRKSQGGITASILSACNADLVAAVKAGTIHRSDNHISRTPIIVDPVGYRELVDDLDLFLEEAIEIQQRAAGRMTRRTESHLVKAHAIQFPSPDPGSYRSPVIGGQPDELEPPSLDDSAVLGALEHETRVHALMVLNERIASAAEIGRELGRPSDHLSYHLKRLEGLKLIERVEAPPGRRGTYYRALIRPWFDQESWKTVDPERQVAITSTMLALCNADIGEAVSTGTINEEDSHISRTPMILDKKSYRELVLLADAVVRKVLQIQQRSAGRSESGAARIATRLHLFVIESPDP